MGDPAGPENCAKSGSLGGRRNSQNASMDDVRFSPLAGDASRDRTIFFAINLHNAFVFIIAQKVFR